MKRSIAVLILALALALTACGGQKAADAQAEAKDITLCPTYDNGKKPSHVRHICRFV